MIESPARFIVAYRFPINLYTGNMKGPYLVEGVASGGGECPGCPAPAPEVREEGRGNVLLGLPG